MQVPLLAGRSFTEDDDSNHPLVGIVNETFAKHYFSSSAAAVGKRVAMGGGNHLQFMTIVGVSRDSKHMSLRRRRPRPSSLRCDRQRLSASSISISAPQRRPNKPSRSVRQAMKQIDPGLAVDAMRTMDDQIETTLSNERMIELLAISFGLLATMLAGVGLYGVLAYSTAQRTREIGIRIALWDRRALVFRGWFWRMSSGSQGSASRSRFPARCCSPDCCGASSSESRLRIPLTLGAVVLLIALVALAAAIVPARRASTVDPTTALRTE